jgi:glycosyltransferase involved in cell wall biosynthesis
MDLFKIGKSFMKDCLANSDQRQPQSRPLVSVLVPSYNHEKFIIDCLESIKGSGYQRLELIVSDDCSSDGTYTLAEQWVQENADRFERVKITKQPSNLGIVKNLQFLFDNIRGEYLAYLASDDMLTQSGILDRLRVFDENHDVDAVFGDCQLISESGEILRQKFTAPHIAEVFAVKKLLPCSLLRFWGTWGPRGPVMMLRRRSVLESGSLGRLPEDLQFEDRYIYIRLASQGKLRFVNSVVARYRVVDNSMSRSSLFAKAAREGMLRSDQKNQHLLTGLNQLYMRMEIAKSKVSIAYSLNKLFWRVNSGVLWEVLYQWSRLSRKTRFFFRQ